MFLNYDISIESLTIWYNNHLRSAQNNLTIYHDHEGMCLTTAVYTHTNILYVCLHTMYTSLQGIGGITKTTTFYLVKYYFNEKKQWWIQDLKKGGGLEK